MDLLLLEHGDLLGVVAAALVVASGIAATALVRAARIARAARAFGGKMRGARRGLRHARPGERVWLAGTLEITGAPVAAFDGTPAASAWAESDGRVARVRADALALRGRISRATLVGAIDLEPTPESAVDETSHAPARARMRELGVATEGGPVTIRAIVDRELVLVIGRAVPVAAREGTSYRSAACALAIGPDEDGSIQAVGLGRPRVTLARVAALGVLVGLAVSIAALVVTPTLSLLAPPLPWTIADAPDHLPYRYWAPLASPLRATARERAAGWIADRLTTRPRPRVLELARTAHRVAPSCELETGLVRWDPLHLDRIDGRCAEAAVVVASLVLDASPAREHARDLVHRWIRDRGAVPAASTGSLLEKPLDDAARALGPSSRGPDETSGWIVLALTLDMDEPPPAIAELRTAWMHDLALVEDASGAPELADRLLAHARRLDPDHPDHDRIARALALRARPLPIPAPAVASMADVRGAPGSPSDVLARYRDTWATGRPQPWPRPPRHLVAALRAAVAADELARPAAAQSLAHAPFQAWRTPAVEPSRSIALRLLP